MLENSKVFVTGASGFIGSHLVRRLKSMGCTVIATEFRNEVKGVDYAVECDVRDAQSLIETLAFNKPDYVFHLAAEPLVERCQKNPITAFSTNVMGTVNLLAGCRGIALDFKHEFKGIVVASTDKVYGRHKELPYDESYELRGFKQFYEASKVGADFATRSFMFDTAVSLPIALTRFGNVYGPGDLHIDSRLIPQTILSYIKDEQPVLRSNGQMKRDFVYIDDVIDGYIALAEYAYTGMYKVFNFGNNRPIRVLDAVSAIREHFPHGKPAKIQYAAHNEIPDQYLDPTHAEQQLGWKAKTSFQDGIAKTVEWYKEAYA